MCIRYVGFNVAAGSRSYDFEVIDTPQEARKFTLNFQSEAFRAARLTLPGWSSHLLCALGARTARERRNERASGSPEYCGT